MAFFIFILLSVIEFASLIEKFHEHVLLSAESLDRLLEVCGVEFSEGMLPCLKVCVDGKDMCVDFLYWIDHNR